MRIFHRILHPVLYSTKPEFARPWIVTRAILRIPLEKEPAAMAGTGFVGLGVLLCGLVFG
jgi:hypothetical protein